MISALPRIDAGSSGRNAPTRLRGCPDGDAGSGNVRSHCAGNTGSLSDRPVIDPSGVGYEPSHFHGFIREYGGGGNRTRVMPLWLPLAKGSEPFYRFVTRLVRCLCGKDDA